MKEELEHAEKLFLLDVTRFPMTHHTQHWNKGDIRTVDNDFFLKYWNTKPKKKNLEFYKHNYKIKTLRCFSHVERMDRPMHIKNGVKIKLQNER
jgi:hypothetical protein